MTNLEWLKSKAEEFNVSSFASICLLSYKLKNKGNGCGCKNCKYCEFNDIEKCIDYLSQECKEPIKLKQWEYDLLTLIDKERQFYSIYKLRKLREKGHFKGVTSTLMDMKEILEDCVIVSDDYEGFEDCK